MVLFLKMHNFAMPLLQNLSVEQFLLWFFITLCTGNLNVLTQFCLRMCLCFYFNMICLFALLQMFDVFTILLFIIASFDSRHVMFMSIQL